MSPEDSGNFVPKLNLPRLYGESVQIRILEVLIQNAIAEEKTNKVIWLNFSDIAKLADVSRSSGSRILDQFIQQGFLEEKKYQTHAQHPPRLAHLNADHPAIYKTIDYYKSVKDFLN